jgi:hypothetical protein
MRASKGKSGEKAVAEETVEVGIDERLEALYGCQVLCPGMLRFVHIDEERYSPFESQILGHVWGAAPTRWGRFASRMFRNTLNGNYILELYVKKDGNSPQEELEAIVGEMRKRDKIENAEIVPLHAGELKTLVKLQLEAVMPNLARYVIISTTEQIL